MKVFDPSNNPIHILQFMPRYDSELCSLTINSQGSEVYQLENESVLIIDGYHFMQFTFPFVNSQEYTMEVTDSDDKVIYRCKAFATDQTDLQNYKINPSVITI